MQDTVMNQGVVAAPGSVTYLYLSSDGVTKGTVLAVRSVPALLTGAGSGPVTTNVTLPTNINGSYYVLVCANGSNAVVESNTANDCTATAQFNVAGADLIETGVSYSGTAASGATIQVTDTAKNQGVVAAPGSVTYFYLSSDGVTKGAVLTVRSVPALLAGASSGPVTTNVKLPTKINGSYYVLVCANGSNAVVESNTANDRTATAPW